MFDVIFKNKSKENKLLKTSGSFGLFHRIPLGTLYIFEKNEPWSIMGDCTA